MKNKKVLLIGGISAGVVLLLIVGIIIAVSTRGCSHKWSQWHTLREATCTEIGTLERVCEKCDTKETTTSKALGHSWNEATCSAPKNCSKCGATEGTSLPHIFNLDIVKAEALKEESTCGSLAIYYKSCSCGAVSTNVLETFETGNIVDHIDNDHDHTCDYGCGKSDMGNHSDSNEDDDHLCDYGCGESFGECYDVNGDHDHNCDECGKADITEHDYSEPTCTAPATCSECGHTTGEPLDHIYDQEVVNDETIFEHATCQSAAKYYKSCECGAISNNKVDIFESGTTTDHIYNREIVKPEALVQEATCESAAIYYLSCECGLISEDDEEVFESGSVLPHNYEQKNHSQATCTSAEEYTYRCECGDEYKETIGDKLGHDITGVEPTEEHVSECEYVLVYICQRSDCGQSVYGEHIYHHEYIASITTPATCLEDGLKTYTCACGEQYTEVIEKDETGHNWVKGTQLGDSRTDKCSLCQETKSVKVYTGTSTGSTNVNNLKDKEIELNDANISLDNGVIDTIGGKNVTVSAEKVEGDNRYGLGLTDDELDQVGENPIYNFTINDGTTNISQFGDDNWVTISLPYTLTEGEDVDSIAVWFINDEGSLESIEATYNNGYVTFKTNHFSYYTVTRLTPSQRCELYGHNYSHQHVEGDCNTDEYDLYVCVRCHDKYIDEETYIVADGHDYTSETQEATCVEHGYITYTCEDCNHKYRTRIAATGHDWEVIEEKESTCVEHGYTVYSCNNCQEEYKDSYEKVPHSFTSTIFEPTCEEDGYTLYECDHCENEYKDEYVAALGHDYSEMAWSWNSDYTAATLIITCTNNEEHTVEVEATIEVETIDSICSDYTKTIYTAIAVYDDVEYIDEQIMEEGTPDHKFVEEWSYDETEHWHECACGERADVSEHTFENEEITTEPTCSEDGEMTSYCECGQIHTEAVPATKEHVYFENVCIVCGCEYVDNYYLNLVNSWQSINGFSIKLENIVIENFDVIDEIVEMDEAIEQITVTELMLYVEDGQLKGAAIGTIITYDMIYPEEYAVGDLKAIIEDGYIYVSIMYGNDEPDKNLNFKLELESSILILIEEILEIRIGEVSTKMAMIMYGLDFLAENVLPQIFEITGEYEEEISDFIGKLFNLIFTFEEQEDGSYLAKFDYEKLHKLNEEFSTMSILDMVDFYFGEESTEILYYIALELFELEIAEIPEYLDSLGFDTEAIIESLNAVFDELGVPEEYYIEEIINNEQFAGIPLGEYIFYYYGKPYEEAFDECVEFVRTYSLYEIIGADYVAELKELVAEYIDGVAEFLTVTFTTDETGVFTGLNIDVEEFEYIEERYEYFFGTYINGSIELLANGTIDVTWDYIIDDINNMIIAPEEEYEEEVRFDSYPMSSSGTVKFQGIEYDTQQITQYYVRMYDYSKYDGIIIVPDCENWISYEYKSSRYYYYFYVAEVVIDEEPAILLFTYASEGIYKVELSDENTMIITSEDGTILEVEVNDNMNYPAIISAYFAAFGKDSYANRSPFYAGEGFYYNSLTNEYTYESQHEYQYEYELQGETCGDGVTVHKTCANCDFYERYERSWCSTEWHYEYGFEEHSECGTQYIVNYCEICKKVDYIAGLDMQCDLGDIFEESITDEEGNEIGTRTTQICETCGLEFITENWTVSTSSCEHTEYTNTYVCKGELSGDDALFIYERSNYYEDHEYEYSYDMLGETCEDGYYRITHCTKCDETYSSYYTYHNTEYRETNLRDYGFCGGYFYGYYCVVCNEVMSSHLSYTYCDWQYVSTNEEGFKVYECNYCDGVKHVHTHSTEKDENCYYQTTTITILLMNGEQIFYAEEVNGYSGHNYRYSYELNGNSCEQGYTTTVTCTDCNYSSYREGSSHYTYSEVINGVDYGCCEAHTVSVTRCACGLNYEVSDDLTSCDDCGWTVVYNEDEIEEGCTLIKSNELTISVYEEVIYQSLNEVVYANHDLYDVTALENENGIITLSFYCNKCDEIIVSERNTQTVELEDHDGSYYYDYYFTPEVSGSYTIQSIYNNNYDYRDTYVTLYRIDNDTMYQLDSDDDSGSYAQFKLTYNLIAGNTYVYRVRYLNQSNSGSITFELLYGVLESSVCECQNASFLVLLNEDGDCTDGSIHGNVCIKCGRVSNVTRHYDHTAFAWEQCDFSAYNVCNGSNVTYYTCACGLNEYVNLSLDWCYTNTTYNEYVDEQGRTIYVEAKTCRYCDIRYQRTYYVEIDHENCIKTTYNAVDVSVGDVLVYEKEYDTQEPLHTYDISYEMINEDASCEDGIRVKYVCSYCDYEYEETYYEHLLLDTTEIDLSEYGSVCGGYAVLEKCLCGKNADLSLEHCLCDYDEQYCEMFISNYLYGSQYTTSGSNWVDYESCIYVCAVTSPEESACGYRIRYANYYLQDENSCTASQYETYQFGYDYETGECLYEVTYKTGRTMLWHDYVETVDDSHTKFDCSICGSYYYSNVYCNEDGEIIKTGEILSNTLDNGFDKYRETIYEYSINDNGNRYISREYYKTINCDGYESWYLYLRNEQPYSTTFGENGVLISTAYSNSYGDSNESQEAYVYYMGYRFCMYEYSKAGSYWDRYDYEYNFDGKCTKTTVYTNSYNETSTYTSDNCHYDDYHTVLAPTCTQDGERYRSCAFCGSSTDSYIIDPTDHNWVAMDGIYFCTTCGLENANGASGDVIMEDLSAKYGNDEYYVAGYYSTTYVDFTTYVSLILENEEEVILDSIEIIEVEGIRAYAFSKASVEALAEELGYTDYDVRFAFVPYGADGSFDYAITFTEDSIAWDPTDPITDDYAFSTYVYEGEYKSFTITPTESGYWTFTSVADKDTYGYLYDAYGNVVASDDDSGKGTNFLINCYLEAGETYVLQVRWYSSDSSGYMPLAFDFEGNN